MADELKVLVEELRTFDKAAAIDVLKVDSNSIPQSISNKLELLNAISANLKTISDKWHNISVADDNDLMEIKVFLSILKNFKGAATEKTFALIALYEAIEPISKVLAKVAAELGDKVIAIVQIGDGSLEVKTLSAVPRAVLFLAGTKLEKCTNEIQSAYLRRLINIVMNGGIPSQLLDHIDALNLGSKYFDSCALPLNLPAGYEVEEKESILRHFENFKSFYSSKHPSEFRLRVLLWDYLINALVIGTKEDSLALDIVPELDVQHLLDLNVKRKVDLVLVSRLLNFPVFFIEYALEESEGIFGHKDFTKLSSLLTIACIRLCQKLQSVGADPSIAQTSGMLVGGTKVQMLVAHPVITYREDQQFDEIHVVVSMNGHWNVSLLGSSKFECTNVNCCSSPLHEITLQGPEVQFDFGNYANKKLKKLKLSEFDDQNETDLAIPRTSAAITVLRENTQLNERSLRKIDSFIKCSKEFIKKLHLIDLKGKPDKFKEIKVPNVANVPQSLPSNVDFTPMGSKVSKVVDKNLEATRASLFNDGSYHKVTKKLTFEYHLYSKLFRNSAIFPHLISAQVDTDHKSVDYKFEKMSEFMGSGNLSLFSESGKFFGSIIRDQHPDYLVLEASTFALHTLFGLHILHEELGVIHGDISPNNIMYSEFDDAWKLNDFESAMFLEDSLKTKRRIGTPGYICPESEETGIFDKSSDIYSLGKVLWSTFVMKLICQVEDAEELAEDTRGAVDQVMNIAREMIRTAPSARPSAKTLLYRFFELLKANLLVGFEIYGRNLILPQIEALLIEGEKISGESIEFKKITINQ